MEYELYHYGVPGMKWGVRKARYRTDSNTARNYKKSINSLNKNYAENMTKALVTYNDKTHNANRIEKISKQKDSNRKQKKLDRLMSNDKILSTKIGDAVDKADKYKKEVDEVVKRMENDKAVVYTTKYGRLGGHYRGNTSYDLYGTEYNVKARTDRRDKSKKYNNPRKKRRYDERMVSTTYVPVVY